MSQGQNNGLASQLVFASLLVGLTVFLVVLCKPAPRVGDGMEYLLMTMAICEKGQTFADQDVGRVYESFRRDSVEGYIPFSDLQIAFASLSRNGEIDFPHFWFYSFLASPFYLFLKCIGGPVDYCFVLLNICLLGLFVSAARSQFGNVGAIVAAAISLASPALWFIDKGHTEFFSVSVGSIGVIYFLKQKYIRSFVAFACLSTQNPPFALIGLLVLGFWLWERLSDESRSLESRSLESRSVESRWRQGRWLMPGLLLGTAIIALHPIYYYSRFGSLTPQMMTGAASSEFKGIRALSCFIIDPDVGLLFNWPWLVVPLVAVPFYMVVWRQPVKKNLMIFVVLSILILCWAQAKTNNFNHGGTVKISRYALWYIPFLFPLLHRFACNYSQVSNIQKACCLFFVVAAVYFNSVKFWPHGGESYLFQTRIAELFYDNFPTGYDPMPEIFLERNLRSEHEKEFWAISNRSGTKIIVHSGRYRKQRNRYFNKLDLGNVYGSKIKIEPGKLVEVVNEMHGIPGGKEIGDGTERAAWFYVNGPGDIFCSSEARFIDRAVWTPSDRIEQSLR
jgi:hypothetical protein